MLSNSARLTQASVKAGLGLKPKSTKPSQQKPNRHKMNQYPSAQHVHTYSLRNTLAQAQALGPWLRESISLVN